MPEYHEALRIAQRWYLLPPHQELAARPLKPTQKQPHPDLARAIFADFLGNPPYGMPAITKLIKEHIPQVHMDD